MIVATALADNSRRIKAILMDFIKVRLKKIIPTQRKKERIVGVHLSAFAVD
ncbi:hypothetical protein D3C87_2190290 [compost metagenome]